MAAMHSRVLEAAPRLRCVACARAGAVNVNLDAARLRGITVTNAPGRNARAVAEFTIGALLAHTRGISAGHRDLSANGAWRTDLYHYESVGRLLPSLTVGIVGFGHVGRLVGQLLGALGCRLLASDPHIPAAVFANAGIDVVPLPRLLAESDVVTLHPRIEAGAPPLIGAAELATMRPDACLIQTARPAALDYDALADALAGGRLAGAVLDVYPDEPLLPTHPLLALPNVTLTPHIAGAARESAEEGAAVAARCVRQFLSGAPVEYPMQ
jgi:D-3-phosphoglycerate dehydrogenase